MVSNTGTRNAGAVNAAIGILALLLIVPLALRSSPPPPPTIAEFAPQIQQHIKAPPPEQVASVGKQGPGGAGQGQGGAGGNPPSSSPVVKAQGTPVPTDKHCLGNPPRQIEDPQSPPCVPGWTGTDNGGNTSQGVTGNTILIYNMVKGGDATNTSEGIPNTAVDSLMKFFNNRFTLYNRTVVMKDLNYTFDGYNINLQYQDAAAVEAQHPFAVINYADYDQGQSFYFYDDLANHGIMSFQANFLNEQYDGDQHYTAHQPYEWNYGPQGDRIEIEMGNFACANLVGKPPDHAGPDVYNPGGSNPPRRFATITESFTNGAVRPDPTLFKRAVEGCGGGTVNNYDIPNSANQKDVQSALAQMRTSDHVTTVFCLCSGDFLDNPILVGASKQGYDPEWLVSHMGNEDNEGYPQVSKGFGGQEANYLFGLRGFNKSVVLADTPQYYEGKTVDANFPPPTYGYGTDLYHNLLILFSGIQMAGPNLTPQSFQDGLFATQFPNPHADAAPYYQARVGFGPGDHTMIQTVTAIWSSTSQTSVEATVAPPGTYCYIQHGVRFTDNDNWRKAGDLDQQMFQTGSSCR